MLLDFSRKLSDSFAYFSAPEVAKRLFFAVTFIKILGYLIFVYSGAQFWTPVTDANLYDAIARGVVVQDHPWGGLLKTMNAHGLYSRTYISAFIFMLNCALVPWLVTKICVGPDEKMVAIDWYLLLMVAFYPTMTIFSADIFRDTPMVVLFLIFLLAFQCFLSWTINQWRIKSLIIYALVALISCYLIYALRFYLAAALLAAVLVSYFLDISRRPFLILSLYLIALLGADAFGFFDALKGSYRASYQGAGSGYGIDFTQGFFLVNFIQSFIYSVYGFYLHTILSVVVFVLESIPILLLTIYIYMNRLYANRFINFLIFFFLIYGALWAIGVDSLGTAVRYRIFNYLALPIAAMLIYKTHMSIDRKTGS